MDTGQGQWAVNSSIPTTRQASSWGMPMALGGVPPLADGFVTRPETAPGLLAAMVPGATVVLAPAQMGAQGPRDWLGPCGKTQLAAYVAEALRKSHGVELLVWVTATSRASVLSSYVEAAVMALGVDPAGEAESVAIRFVSWLAETSRPWLVVLDALSDPSDLDGLWPEGPSGMVLITTSNPATLSGEYQTRLVPVGPFSPREALSYLMGRLTADPDQRLGGKELVEDLRYEPLALSQATAMISSSTVSCHEYRGYFARRREQLAEATRGRPPTAVVTWRLSFEHATRMLPSVAPQSLLALAAVLDGRGIPGAVFATSAVRTYLAREGADLAARDPAQAPLLVLERTGLLSIDPVGTPPIVRMSPAVQAAVRAAMPDEMLEQVTRAAADALLEVWPEKEAYAWLDRAMRSCATNLQEAAGDLLWTDGCHPLLLLMGRTLDGARLTGPAVAWWRELAEVSNRLLGPGHPDTLIASEKLAEAYLTAGRAAEAVSWFQRVLADRARGREPDRPRTIATQRRLGYALVAANQLGDAVTVLEGTIRDFELVLGPDHLDTLGARDDLAAAYLAVGMHSDAIRLYQRTLSDRERIQGQRHPDAITTRQKLADSYLSGGKLRDARSQYKRVLADREQVLGRDHLATIAARGSLGSAYRAAGRMASALQLYEQACAGYDRVLGAEHPDTLACRANLANAYYKVGRLSDALAVLRDTLARCERVLPPGDPLTYAVWESLTNITG
jgi:tetratricopeptide (TPR) repeat protein